MRYYHYTEFYLQLFPRNLNVSCAIMSQYSKEKTPVSSCISIEYVWLLLPSVESLHAKHRMW